MVDQVRAAAQVPRLRIPGHGGHGLLGGGRSLVGQLSHRPAASRVASRMPT
ncbi:hypothetical protein ACFFX0_24695 [Citricoccus parietis]|uniref:Uncharacterized protein n=1 Tax=Citricoccus parietis TaxID=592307 RepID=A0ABV5G717_9MICC